MPPYTKPNNQLPFEFSGQVVPGQKVGRKISFPTANLNRVPSESVLQPGVYAGSCSILYLNKIRNHDLKCLAYFGPRYVFGETQNSFEVYIYHYDQTIYNHTLEITLLKFIRPPKDMTDLGELKTQLEKDKTLSLELLSVQ